MNKVTNKYGEIIQVGDILFMESPASLKWPRTFPESSWMFLVRSVDSKYMQGPSVNWKRKGKGYVSREIDELGELRFSTKDDNRFHGLRKATPEETTYFFKRAPEYKRYLKAVEE